MPVSVARQIAFDVLNRVESSGAYASDLLFSKLQDVRNRADAALATEITLGVLRWRRLLDFLLQRQLDRPLARLDVEVLLALRIGLYQMRFLDRVPARAAVNESVELTKKARKRSAATLVNAILRRAEKDAKLLTAELEILLQAETLATERLGTIYSHPTWIVERWLKRFGDLRTKALLEKNNCTPDPNCAVLDPAKLQNIIESLQRDGIIVQDSRWLASALTISSGNPANTDAFRKGEISIQDEASQMVGRLLDAEQGETVLDLCAAPGGKTGMLARSVAPDGKVLAADVHEHRLRAAREQLARTATTNVSWIALDASRHLPFAGNFQRILVDAPCSGTGTLARNPEIKWRLKPADLAAAHKLQAEILKRALALLAPGGRLVYATCSLEQEENEQVVSEVLPDFPDVRIIPGESSLQKWLRPGKAAAELFDANGFFRTFPPESGTDGFFAAVLKRSR